MPISRLPWTGEPDGLSLAFGVGDSVSFRSLFPFHASTDATVEFWLKFPARAHEAVLWTRQDQSDTNRFNFYVNGDGTFGFDYKSPFGDLHPLISGVPIESNTWTHLAITRSGNLYTLYKNGSVAAQAMDSSPALPTANGWSISGRACCDFQGQIDELRVFNRALTRSELLLSPGSAPSWDAARDYSAIANPNGPWSYGWSTSRGSPFNLSGMRVQPSGLDAWTRGTDFLPVVLHNGTTNTITSACCNPLPPGSLAMHPSALGENAVVRWTAPAAGVYGVSATFMGRDEHGTTTDVAILHNGNTLFTGEVTGYLATQTFSSSSVALQAGDVVDFKVGFGIDGDYGSDTTGLDATVSFLAPPPDTSPPVTTASLAGAAGMNGWYTGPVTVTLMATDPDGAGDVYATYYTLDGAAAAQAYTGPFAVSGDAVHHLRYWSVDKAGNVEQAHAKDISIDTTSPTTTAIFQAGALPAGFVLVSVSGMATVRSATGGILGTVEIQCFDTVGILVNLKAHDDLSGVANLNYQATGAQVIASQTVPGDAAVIRITSEGLTTLTYGATDMAGNQEGSKSATVAVGRTDDGGRFACGGPTPASFTFPAHGMLVVSGTATAGSASYSFGGTMSF